MAEDSNACRLLIDEPTIAETCADGDSREGTDQLGPTSSFLVHAETNFLRFPLFALDNKGLDKFGIRVTGTRTVREQKRSFSLSITRNSTYPYPGPLARDVHFALLSLIKDEGFPFSNPIAFGWRELARRMGRPRCAGRDIQHMKHAIASIHGIVIQTDWALVDGHTREPLTRERHMHLYDECVFVNDRLPDGTRADENFIWLSDWYVANLNAFYTAPLDYDVWRHLNGQSRIASRLYEFLIFVFNTSNPVRINYATLADFLPVRKERHRSAAKKQLTPALQLLKRNGLLARFTWTEARSGAPQLEFTKGESFGSRRGRSKSAIDDPIDDYHIEQIGGAATVEHQVVTEFHRLWSGDVNYPPFPAELAFARQMCDRHGAECVQRLLPRLVKTMKQHYPNAKTFNGAQRYFDEVLAVAHRQQRRAADDTREREQRRAEQERDTRQRQERLQRRDLLTRVWGTLSDKQREAYEQAAIANAPGKMIQELLQKKRGDLLLRAALKELDRDLQSRES